MEERVLHIKLVYRSIFGVSQSDDGADSCRLDNRAESFIIINSWSLGEAAKDPTSLVSVQGTVSMEFVLEDSFASDHIGFGGTRDKFPRVVVHQGSMLFLHSPVPDRVGESIAAGPGQRRESLSVENTRLLEAGLPTGRHAMGVGDGWDGHGASRKSGAGLDVAWRGGDEA